ncbi:MAG: tRNA (adenosine(37)-N6)-dimethylallyltransferase MiaA [Candidatus Moranbacteria bacterium]|nr:tRNA (adenosine(37)-N6)-dimethylallyltransferase MiaA [Candidatus Moranbacteria bacterium]MDD3965375.1 tRNA (adenosine(37)-N6)-dimethylallyltransferase MiaA [Candidatus Moranbacteria bacterium]
MYDKTIVIVGPTASGKSDLAIALAKKYNGEIISADSRQVYRGMDIGTGKVIRDKVVNHSELVEGSSKKEVFFSEGIIHHLLDVASPKRTYNVTHFVRDTKKIIIDIRNREKIPIICGGTGFWVQSFIDGTLFPVVKPNTLLRKKLSKLSAEELFLLLQKKDPSRAQNIDAKNKVRLIRALEICDALGTVPTLRCLPRLDRGSMDSRLPARIATRIVAGGHGNDTVIIALCPPQETLHKNIEARLEKRLAQGMIAEIETLRANGISWKRLESFGLEYKYVALFLQKKIALEKMKERLNFEIRHYAKRQITWLRRWEKMGATIHWVTKPKEVTEILKKNT